LPQENGKIDQNRKSYANVKIRGVE